MKVAEQFLTDSMLLSAYDIYHGHLDFPTSALTKVMYVDGGGYETSDLQDLSATYIHKTDKKKWDEDLLYSVLNQWPTFAPAIFVTYDRADDPQPLDRQIERLRKLRAAYPGQLIAVLVKPETKDQKYVQAKQLIARIEEFGAAHIIGLTEKELGNSFIERMQRLSELRLALDDAKMQTVPIHVFGSLDPVSVCG